MDAERASHAAVRGGDREGGTARVDPGADRDDPVDPGRPCAREKDRRRARRTRPDARACRSRRSRLVDARKERRRGLDPVHRRRSRRRARSPTRARRLPERVEDRAAMSRHEGGERDGHAAEAVGEVVEHLVERVARSTRPWPAPTASSPRRTRSAAARPARSPRARPSGPRRRSARVTAEPSRVELGADRLRPRSGVEPAAAVARDHRRRPREQVPELVSELPLVALADALERDRAVLAERDRADRPEADGIGAVDVDEVERADYVSDRLRDLLLFEQEISVDEDLLRDARTRPTGASPASRRSGSAGCPWP